MFFDNAAAIDREKSVKNKKRKYEFVKKCFFILESRINQLNKIDIYGLQSQIEKIYEEDTSKQADIKYIICSPGKAFETK